jgi:hypothetical protein
MGISRIKTVSAGIELVPFLRFAEMATLKPLERGGAQRYAASMHACGDDPGGFFRGFRQSRVAYVVACLALLTGVALLVWSAIVPGRGPWPTWKQLCAVVLLAGPMIWMHRQAWSYRRRQGTELERLKERRTGALILAFEFLFFAAAAGWFAVKVCRSTALVPPAPASRPGNAGLTGFDSLALKLLTSFAAAVLVSVAAAAVALWYYRRTGQRIRRLEGHCATCGYDLRGLPEPRCPECGSPFTPRPASK